MTRGPACLFAMLAACQVVSGLRKRRSVSKSSPTYDQALFMSTHNSYEKKPLGIIESLDYGVRLIEFDLRLNYFAEMQDYCMGHFICYDWTTQVGEMGNPDTHFIRAWLQQVRNWSTQHPDHAPIAIMLDMKDNLASGGNSYAQGGFSFLQDMWQDIFGDSVYWASEKPAGSWPTVDELRGRVMAVLSGNTNSRIFYQQDEGYRPRAAVNDAGLVVETHENRLGRDIYYWTGRMSGDGIAWLRHGWFDSGKQTFIALSNSNAVVEVHKSENVNHLFYHVGTLDSDLEITWGPSVRYDNGTSPTIQFLPDGRVQERHLSAWTGKVWVRNGTIDVASQNIVWEASATQVDVPLFDIVARSPSGANTVEVKEEDTLVHYKVGGQAAFQKISYQQLFFADWQPGCGGDSENYSPLNQGTFIGVSRRCGSAKRMEGVATRVWQYSMADMRDGKEPGSHPATDEPDEAYKAWVLSKPYGIGY